MIVKKVHLVDITRFKYPMFVLEYFLSRYSVSVDYDYMDPNGIVSIKTKNFDFTKFILNPPDLRLSMEDKTLIKCSDIHNYFISPEELIINSNVVVSNLWNQVKKDSDNYLGLL